MAPALDLDLQRFQSLPSVQQISRRVRTCREYELFVPWVVSLNVPIPALQVMATIASMSLTIGREIQSESTANIRLTPSPVALSRAIHRVIVMVAIKTAKCRPLARVFHGRIDTFVDSKKQGQTAIEREPGRGTLSQGHQQKQAGLRRGACRSASGHPEGQDRRYCMLFRISLWYCDE